jgi:hypothetical protein
VLLPIKELGRWADGAGARKPAGPCVFAPNLALRLVQVMASGLGAGHEFVDKVPNAGDEAV